MKLFRMPKWFIANADKDKDGEDEPLYTSPQPIHRPVVEETKRKPRRLAPRKLLLVRRKDVVKFYMVGRRLQVLCANAVYSDGSDRPDDDWFAIGMVVEQPVAKLMIYDGTVFSMAGLDIEEKFHELRKLFPDFVFDNNNLTLSKKE